jgi:hypothetical protein
MPFLCVGRNVRKESIVLAVSDLVSTAAVTNIIYLYYGKNPKGVLNCGYCLVYCIYNALLRSSDHRPPRLKSRSMGYFYSGDFEASLPSAWRIPRYFLLILLIFLLTILISIVLSDVSCSKNSVSAAFSD